MNTPIKNLSYSSLLTLHSCPRKFQLYRMSIQEETEEEDITASLTLLFGHTVGEGLQHTLLGLSEDEIIWKSFLRWNQPLDLVDEKRKKSLYFAIFAIQRFHSLYSLRVLLDGYELVIMPNGKPAIELSFIINCPNGFKFRGFIDAILRHKDTGEIVILEDKTTAARSVQPAMYQNSSQAVGYSVVLDALFPDHSSYKVIYCVYKTTELDYEIFTFGKSFLHRALWLQELLLDIDTIMMYEGAGIYPMRGESCLGKYFKPCKYLNLCTLSTEYLINNHAQAPKEKNEIFDFTFDLETLIHTQLEK